MSHWTICKIRIKNPNQNILKEAMSLIARELNSTVVEDFEVRGYNKKERCLLGIPMKLPYGNGFGITTKDGELVVVGDDHGAPISINELTERLYQYYIMLGVNYLAKQYGFRVSSTKTKDALIIDLIR